MSEPVGSTENLVPTPMTPPRLPVAQETVESRIQRLEAALAAMQDTKLMEDRLLERVMTRVDQQPTENGTASSLLGAASPLVPAAAQLIASQIGAATSPTAPDTGSIFSARTWLLTDLMQEFRTFFAMYLDFRYTTTWLAKIVPLAALAIFALSWIFLRSLVLVVGPVLDYAIDLILVIVVYKTWQREAARYRQAVAHLPARR